MIQPQVHLTGTDGAYRVIALPAGACALWREHPAAELTLFTSSRKDRPNPDLVRATGVPVFRTITSRFAS